MYLVTQATNGKSRSKFVIHGSFFISNPGTRSVFAAATIAIFIAPADARPGGVSPKGDVRDEGLNSAGGLAPGPPRALAAPRARDADDEAIELRTSGSHKEVTELSVAGLEASYSTITQSAARNLERRLSRSEPKKKMHAITRLYISKAIHRISIPAESTRVVRTPYTVVLGGSTVSIITLGTCYMRNDRYVSRLK
jgi:hypothetical protein